jgi:hypothetical protein
MVVRKALSLSSALGFVLINMAMVCMGVCWARCDMPGFQYTAEAEGGSQPLSCCSEPEACPCQVSQGWPSQLPDSSVFAVPRVGNPAQADITDSALDVFPPLHFQSGFTNEIWKFGAGPSLALYLQNLSLLC